MGTASGRGTYVVVGAGPYGLAVASHLRAAGLEARVFGRVMDFWDRQMPRGMVLRSPWNGSHIDDPAGALSLGRYEAALGRALGERIPLEDFVRYGQWFQNNALPDADARHVARLERVEGGFRLTLEDGETVAADGVVVATGIGAFPHVPEPFAALPTDLATHASASVNRDLGRLAGKDVVVVGAGQSATESAALLAEAGARVEQLVRQPQLRWLKSRPAAEWFMDLRLNPFKTPGKIGPLGINWLIEHPRLFTAFPRATQDWMSYRAIRPAASGWLKPRVQSVRLTVGRGVVAAEHLGARVRLRLDDGTERSADHVLLGTGYRIDIARTPFLTPELLGAVRTVRGYPVLNAGLESSLPGLYFVGAPAAYSFGPLCRFVAGTGFTARTLTRHALRRPVRRTAALVPA